MNVLFSTPWWAVLIVFTGGLVIISCGGHVLVRRSFPKHDFVIHNEVAGCIVAVVGMLYAVLLGFLTVVVWQQFSEAEARVTAEATAAMDVWRFAHYVRPLDEHHITQDLATYARDVIDLEWPAMKLGQSSATTQEASLRLIRDIASLRATTANESNLQTLLLERVRTIVDLRQQRINDERSGIPPVLWAALVAGAVTVIGFEYLFGLPNFRVQLLMTGATAIIIGLSLSVIVKLDFPFRGDTSVSPERWLFLEHEIVQRG